jgi:hypothetical protein
VKTISIKEKQKEVRVESVVMVVVAPELGDGRDVF